MTERLSLDMECHEGAVMLHLEGHLDSTTVPLLAGVLEAVVGGIWGAVVVDLQSIHSMDGAAIDVLLDAEAISQRDGHALEIGGLQASLRRRRPRQEADQYARQARQTL